MTVDLSNLSDRLTKKSEALSIVTSIKKEMLFPYPPENISMELYAYLSYIHEQTCIDAIFDYATSSEEKIFLSSVLLFALTEGVFFLDITPPLHSAFEKIARLRNNYSLTMQMWSDYQSHTGEKTMNQFLDGISKLPLAESIKEEINRNMCMHIYDIYNTFFFSLKADIAEIAYNNKPTTADILIWTLADPSFRLVVEIDEANYYPDKTTFTNDRAKDRWLQSKGVQVLRFSGQEIIGDPLAKASELIGFLEKRRDKKTRLSSK